MTDRQGIIQRSQFAQVDITLLEQCIETSHKGALFVYLWLWHYAGRSDTAFPSVGRLALECRMNHCDVRDALKWLTSEGWIKADPRPGATTVYHVRTERPERKQLTSRAKTPTPKGVPLPQKGQGYPYPDQGSTPLPRLGEGTPTPKGTPNKKDLTRNNEQEVRTPLIPQHAEPAEPPQAAAPTDTKPSRSKAKKQEFDPTQEDIPAHLLPVASDLLDFWQGKRGSKSLQAWKALLTQLAKIQNDANGGTEVLRAQIQKGIQVGWQSITHENWQRFAKPALPFGNGTRPRSRVQPNGEFMAEVLRINNESTLPLIH